MSQFPIFRFKLDLTGNKPENRVTYELVHLSNAVGNRTIVPKYGAFYAASLKIRQVGMSIDANALTNISLSGAAPLIIGGVDLGDEVGLVKYVVLSNQLVAGENGLYAYTVDNGGAYTLTSVTPGALLTPSAQYKTFMLNQDATRMSGGKFVDQLIVLSDESVQGWLILEYQAVGGIFSTAPDVLEQLITILDLDNRPVNWHDIVELPPGFNPTPHYHHSSEFFGYGGLISAIERMYLAVINLGEDKTTPGLNRGIFPPIEEYTGPVYSNAFPIEEAKTFVKNGDGGILTYLGKITPQDLPTYDISTQTIRINYLTTDHVSDNSDLDDDDVDYVHDDTVGIIEGELILSFPQVFSTSDFDENNVIRSKVIRKSYGENEPRTQFLFYPIFSEESEENTKTITAIYLFELANTNRGLLSIYTDELPGVVSWSDGVGKAKIGVDSEILFDDINQDLGSVDGNPTESWNYFIIDKDDDGNISLSNNDDLPYSGFLQIFRSAEVEDEYVFLSDIADMLNEVSSSMTHAAKKLEKQTRIISEVSSKYKYLNPG